MFKVVGRFFFTKVELNFNEKFHCLFNKRDARDKCGAWGPGRKHKKRV